MTATEMFGIVTPIVVAIMAGWGTVLWRVSTLERKIDKYNGLVGQIKDCEQDIEHIKGICPLCPKSEVT
mgnify:CR=1 FL=1